MKDSSGPCKTTPRIPDTVRHHLNRFAIAIILAGLGLFGLAPSAEAEVVYTNVNVHIPANSSYNLDLNNDGTTDFTISASDKFGGVCHAGGPVFYRWYTTFVDEIPAPGNGVTGSPPAALNSGALIGPNQTFYGGTGTLRSYYKNPRKCGSSATGNWATQSIHYLGLAFEINGETFYGWAELKVNVGISTASATLLGYAYENTPGLPINAGQTQDGSFTRISDPANPASSGLVASVTKSAHSVSLDTRASGNHGVPLMRRKESVATAAENI